MYFCSMNLSQFKLKEFVYQVILSGVLFLMYSLDKHDGIQFYDFIFFSFYVSVAVVINYVFLPKYFRTKKLWLFWVLILITLVIIFVVEEYVLEPIFVSGSRGKYVSNVFFTLFNILPYLFMMVGFKLAWDSWQKQQKLDELQRIIRDNELRFLKSQINPHFLFNNLNNLYSYAIENSSKTPSIILELSSVLRYMLYDCKEDFVPLHKEIEHLQNFTALNELQIEERGKIRFTKNITSNKFVIAPLIVSVFIENAFKHSTASQSENINIGIDVNVNSNGLLEFSCVNSFSTMSNNDNLSHGIGLDNVKKRLEILYPNNHKLIINTINSVYDVSLTMQLKEYI